MPIEQNYRNHQIRLPRSIVCLANEPLFISFCKEILIFLDVCIIIPGKFTLRFLYLQNISLISIKLFRNQSPKPSFSIVLLNSYLILKVRGCHDSPLFILILTYFYLPAVIAVTVAVSASVPASI